MRLANLNVFLACLVLSYFLLSTPAMMLVMIVTSPFNALIKNHESWLFFSSYLLIFISLLLLSLKYNLSPKVRKPERERRFRVGHWLIGVMHIIALVSVVTPFLIAKISNNPENGLYLWFAIPVIGIGFFVWASGLFMVWSSRA